MRLEAMLKGVGIDALRAMAIVPGAKTLLQGFAKILNKIKLPVSSNIGGNLIGNEIGAVGNVSKLKESKKISSLDEIPKNYFISDLIGKNPNAVIKDLEYEIANNLKNPKNSLDNILQGGGTIEGRNIRANSWVSSRLNNINNFVKYIENAHTYNLPNKFKITPEGVSNLVNQIKDNTLIYVKDLIKNIDKFQDANTFNIDYDNFKRLQTIIDKLQ